MYVAMDKTLFFYDERLLASVIRKRTIVRTCNNTSHEAAVLKIIVSVF